MTQARKTLTWCVASGCLFLICSCGQSSPEQAASPKPKSESTIRTVKATRVISQILSREVRLPADLLAFRDVMIFPKVPGFIEWIGVDRGSTVKSGDLLIRMTAPELHAQTEQSTDQATAARDAADQIGQELGVVRKQLDAAKAKSKATSDTYERLKGASASYAGIIAGNDLEIAQKNAEADANNVESLKSKIKALEAQLMSFKNKHKAAIHAAGSTRDIQAYLLIKAAFDGKITERNVHEGSFVHPPATDAASIPLLRLQQLSVLRLTVPVPETDVSCIVSGASVPFTVSAFPGQIFTGVVRRIADSVDLNTRTMAVEMDVANNHGQLTPGMFAEVMWPMQRKAPTLFVPASSVVKTTERTFVVRIKPDNGGGIAEWVDVKPGVNDGDQVEVFGDLKAGDLVVTRGTDELRAGTRVEVQEQTKASGN